MKARTLTVWMTGLLLSASFTSNAQNVPVATGRYTPDWDNLAQWECPEWFQNVKFGIWAHWDPQSQGADGDWYGRGMYFKGGGNYNWHVSHFGDPCVAGTDYGYKDLCNAWKAEKWEPEYLIRLYYDMGARYFFAMGQHHDNFDCWDSPYQPWNSVNIGPKRDVVGEWAKACEKYDLPLGVSMHGSHAWLWFEIAQQYDANMTKEDGKGKWWEGYDPQDLYAQRHTPSRGWEDAGTIHSQWTWGNGASQPSEEYKMKFQNRVLQCVNAYHPAMLYFDDTVLPFYGCDESVGLNILAHSYNTDPEMVVTGKVLDSTHKEAMLWDIERGIPDRPQEKPWQTCTCIGGWHYGVKDYNAGYKSAQQEFSPEQAPIRTALVTARSAPAHERVVRTLRAWNIRIDEAFFLGGISKKEILAAFGAHIFFDDQAAHTGSVSAAVPSARVPSPERKGRDDRKKNPGRKNIV